MPLRRYDLNQITKTAEVGDIEGEQPGDAMREHDGYQVGIMYLLACAGVGSQESQQKVELIRAIVQNVEGKPELTDVRYSLFHRESCHGRLSSSCNGKVLAQYLPTDPRQACLSL